MEAAALHKQALAQFCRVCGACVKSEKNLSSKENNEQLILSVHGVDIKLDDENIHPPSICLSCRDWMTQRDSSQAEGTTHPTCGRNLATFSAHQESCTICSPASTKRKASEDVGPSPLKKAAPNQSCELQPSTSQKPSETVGPATSGKAALSVSGKPPPSSAAPVTQYFLVPRNILPATVLSSSKKPVLLESGQQAPSTKQTSSGTASSVTQASSVQAGSTESSEKQSPDSVGPSPLKKAASNQSCELQPSTSQKPSETARPAASEKAALNVSGKPPPSTISPSGGKPITHYVLVSPGPKPSTSTSATAAAIATQYRQIKPRRPGAVAPVPFTWNPGLPPSRTYKKCPGVAKGRLHYVRSDVSKKRTQGAADLVRSFCSSYNEDETDLLFYLLHKNLKTKADQRYKSIFDLWTEKESTMRLTVDECIALRVGTLCTKGKQRYAEEYRFLKSKGDTTLKPPSALNERESAYMPASCKFALEDGGQYIHHKPAKSANSDECGGQTAFEPCRINELRDVMQPNCIGVAWSYVVAVAKTLEELEDVIRDGLHNVGLNPKDQTIVIHTTIKDNVSGTGELSIHKSKRDLLPDKALRASFAILKCEVKREDGTMASVFEEENPNSVLVNRPILEAVGDSNLPSTSALLLRKMEAERRMFHGHKMKIFTDECTRTHEIIVCNGMVHEELSMSLGGPQESEDGGEEANKLFRNLRENLARRVDVFGGLRDVLCFHWLYTSPKLLGMREVSQRKYQCTKCGGDGHNVTSCKAISK